MGDSDAKLRPWSSLTEAEQTELMIAYQPLLDMQARTCSFDAKLARMQDFLRTRGVSITEKEIRPSASMARA